MDMFWERGYLHGQRSTRVGVRLCLVMQRENSVSMIEGRYQKGKFDRYPSRTGMNRCGTKRKSEHSGSLSCFVSSRLKSTLPVFQTNFEDPLTETPPTSNNNNCPQLAKKIPITIVNVAGKQSELYVDPYYMIRKNKELLSLHENWTVELSLERAYSDSWGEGLTRWRNDPSRLQSSYEARWG